MHAWYAVHARTFLLSDFVSVENKGSKIHIPKLDVAGSIPVARSIVLSDFQINFPNVNRNTRNARNRPATGFDY